MILDIQFVVAKKHVESVTLVCVAGVQIQKALSALLISAYRLGFGKIIFVTPRIKPLKLGKFSVERPINSRLDSLEEYNRYILYKLSHHISTAHCLLIQADGYVLKGKLWRDEFLQYDYIGAPWPIEENRYIDPFGNHQRVGNGGFSLRSKKLLLVPQHISIPWEVNEGSFYRHFNQKSYSEDGNICVHNRHLFEKAGCKFAPLGIAMAFSRELDSQDLKFGPTFGFHKYHPNTNFVRKLMNRLNHSYKRERE